MCGRRKHYSVLTQEMHAKRSGTDLSNLEDKRLLFSRFELLKRHKNNEFTLGGFECACHQLMAKTLSCLKPLFREMHNGEYVSKSAVLHCGANWLVRPSICNTSDAMNNPVPSSGFGLLRRKQPK